jgi:5'(3')-deoxyribonucleotidase
MDGVLADVYKQFIAYHEKDTGVRLEIEQLKGLPEFKAFPHGHRHANTRGFFRTVPVVPGSREVLEQLNQQYEIFIVSAAMEFPSSLGDKREWLNEHFPFIHWRQIAFCGSKEIVKADIMIDDHLKNLDKFEGDTFLFSQPHNSGLQTRHRRVDTWEEIAELLLT